MVDAIVLAKEKHHFDLWARVIMPEHVHLVLLLHEHTRIAGIFTTMKQSVSRRAMIWLKENSPLFPEKLLDLQPNGKRSCRFWKRGGGYDRNLRSVCDVHEKVLYIHQNPVKRGLVETPELWEWSSARA